MRIIHFFLLTYSKRFVFQLIHLRSQRWDWPSTSILGRVKWATVITTNCSYRQHIRSSSRASGCPWRYKYLRSNSQFIFNTALKWIISSLLPEIYNYLNLLKIFLKYNNKIIYLKFPKRLNDKNIIRLMFASFLAQVLCEVASEIGMLMQSDAMVKSSMDIIVTVLLKCRHKGVMESAGVAIANLSRWLFDAK